MVETNVAYRPVVFNLFARVSPRKPSSGSRSSCSHGCTVHITIFATLGGAIGLNWIELVEPWLKTLIQTSISLAKAKMFEVFGRYFTRSENFNGNLTGLQL